MHQQTTFMNDIQIERARQEGELVICPYSKQNLTPVGYNLSFNPYITCGFIMLGTIGMGIEAYKEYRRQRNKVYSIIICAVLSVILLVSFFCFKGGYDSILVLLSCIVILVFISKLIEQLRNRLYYHKV